MEWGGVCKQEGRGTFNQDKESMKSYVEKHKKLQDTCDMEEQEVLLTVNVWIRDRDRGMGKQRR